MQLAIVHYHLNRGGVMQVIAGHLRSVNAALGDDESLRVALLYGGRREGWPETLADELPRLDLQLCEVDGLDYDDASPADPGRLAGTIVRRLSEIGFSPRDTILHVHNHALGKNLGLPGALCQLASDGYAMVLQIHDFAEDFRPDVYGRWLTSLGDSDPDRLPDLLYPQADNVHYAVLNRRDEQVLRLAGVDPVRIHFLPNPVVPFPELPDRDSVRSRMAIEGDIPSDRPLMLYPVRCIRRKNVGEALLWAAAGAGRATVGFTLAPMNPLETPSYESWKKLASQLELPCRFEMGEQFTFFENLAAADASITTSVAEGFGMVFLEAWLANRPLVGRDLPEITADFVEHGLALPWLHDRLSVPLAWVGRERFAADLLRCYRATLAAFDRPAPQPQAAQTRIDALTAGDVVDFALLDTAAQDAVIRQVQASGAKRDELLAANPHMATAFAPAPNETAATIEHNAAVVQENYAPQVCGRRLRALYRAAWESERSSELNGPPRGTQILDFFLDLKRFRPLRSQT